MGNLDEQLDWLKHIKKQKLSAIFEWEKRAITHNICDENGKNPISKLHNEIDIANSIIFDISQK